MIILGKEEEEEEDDTLTGTLLSVDVATKENLENFVNVGEELLKMPISRVNLATGVFEPINKIILLFIY